MTVLVNKRHILLSAVDILDKQVQFHIDAKKRSRYAKAAYYCGVVLDIYNILGETDKEKDYLSLLIARNGRRPALNDEIRKKFN